MTQSKLGITPGECKWNEFRDHTLRADGWGVIAEVYMHPNNPNGRATGEAHAHLFLDAHNVANRTGLTPSELERQRDELLEVLKEIRHFAGAGIGMAAKNDHAEAVTLATWIIEKVDEAITSATEPHP